MRTSSHIRPDADAFEKSDEFNTRQSPVPDSSSDSRSSISSQSEQQFVRPVTPESSCATPIPAWLDISLAVMTLGLSVPAFHAVRGVAERRAAKKAQTKQQAAFLSAPDSYLVPSSVVRAPTTATNYNKTTELDSLPLEPPPYSPRHRLEASSQDTKATVIAELP